MHCSNEGHLIHFWRRKIAFIKLHGKQNEVMLFSFFFFNSRNFIQEASLVIEEGPGCRNKEQKQSDDQKVVLSANLLLNCSKGLFNASCALYNLIIDTFGIRRQDV